MEIFKRGKIVIIVAFVLILIGIGVAIILNKNEEGATKITFALDWSPNTNHTGLFVAKEKGFFAEEGLEVEFVQPPEDTATALIAAKKADFGIDFQDHLAVAFEKNIPVTAVATIIQHNTSGIISLKEDNIITPKDMENKTYATPELPIEQAIIKYAVESGGGDVSKINMIPTYVTDIVQGLKTDIDSVWIFYGWEGIAAEVAGLETNFFNFKDINEEFDYYTPVIVGNNEYIEKNPETTKKFLRAVKRGYEYSIEHPEEAAEILLKEAEGLDRELVMESQKWLAKEYKAEVEQWGYIDETRWNAFYKWLYENGLMEKEISGGFTNKYLED